MDQVSPSTEADGTGGCDVGLTAGQTSTASTITWQKGNVSEGSSTITLHFSILLSQGICHLAPNLGCTIFTDLFSLIKVFSEPICNVQETVGELNF